MELERKDRFVIFGYDAPRLHAALNDLPPALLPLSVLFDLLGAHFRRESFRAVGLWTLVVGVLGTGVAIVSGLFAQNVVEHSDEAHAVMKTHETLAFIVLGIFGILAVWRVARRGAWSAREQPVALTAGVIGVVILTYAAMLGGKLMFDHGVGIPTTRLEVIPVERGAEHHHHGAEEAPHAAPVPGAASDTAHAHGDAFGSGHRHPAAADSPRR